MESLKSYCVYSRLLEKQIIETPLYDSANILWSNVTVLF